MIKHSAIVNKTVFIWISNSDLFHSRDEDVGLKRHQ